MIPQTIDEFLKTSCQRSGQNQMLSVLRISGSEMIWDSLTGDEAWIRIDEMKRRLLLAGVTSASRIAIVGETSLDWMIYFFAALRCGATVCPLDIKLTAEECHDLIVRFASTHVFSSRSFAAELEKNPRIQNHTSRLIVFGDLSSPSSEAVTFLTKDLHIASESAKLIIYTSGTLGTPKGVVISLASVFFEIVSISSGTVTPPHYRTAFSIMPLNHIYGVTAGLFYYMWNGLEFTQTQSLAPEHIAHILAKKSVHQLMTVPLLLKLLRNGILAKVKLKPKLSQYVFHAIIWLNSKLKSTWIANLVFGEVRKTLAPHLERIVCGGAPLDAKYEDFFQALAWPVFAGYGLTETGPVISVNTDLASCRGSVGKPLQGVEVKIEKESPHEPTGEILTRGPHVFKNYENAPELTKEVLRDDGWFSTGDLGYLDRNGFLFIVGRQKSMIVLPSGKKIQPEEVEKLLLLSPLIKDVCVLGLPDKEMGVKIIAQVLLENAAEVADDLNITKPIAEQLRALCKSLAPFKRPQEFRFRKTPFPMTSSQKIKRHQVQKEIERGRPL
jgi:long-chain acyl-CoA synthetase